MAHRGENQRVSEPSKRSRGVEQRRSELCRTQLRYVDGTGLGTADLPGDTEPGTVVGIDASGVCWEIVELDRDDTSPSAVVALAEPGADRHPGSAAQAAVRRVGSTDGVRLALHSLGGSGPALLICHATGFCGLAYAPLARSLVDRFSVWAVDFRGHGASTQPASGDYDWQGMGEDVLACVEAIGGPVIGVGHSMGGAALFLAELQAPGTVRAAYMFEPIVVPEDFEQRQRVNPMVAPARGRRREFESRRAALQRYADKPPLSDMRIDALAAYTEHGLVDDGSCGGVRLACEPADEASTFAADKIPYSRLAGIDMDLMVACGSLAEAWSPAEFAPGVAEAVDSAALRHHPELGHLGPFEDPTAVGQEIASWLAA